MRTTIKLSLFLVGILSITLTNAQESDQGDLIYLNIDVVAPENMIAYEQWNKEFMEAAKGLDMPTFWTFESGGQYTYASSIGKTIDGITEYNEKWETLTKENPSFGDLWSKYAYTVQSSRRELWRHHPELSYTPENPSSEDNNYVRAFVFWVKGGKMNEAMELLKEYKKAFEDAGIAEGYGVYRNVMGADGNQMTIRQGFRDPAHWGSAQKISQEKLGETMGKLWTRWSQVIVKMEDNESWYRKEFSILPDESN